MSLVPGMGGRNSDRVLHAVAAYLDVAERHGLDPVHMALAWCRSRPFMGSVIFGATTEAQLTHILNGLDLELSPEVIDDIDETHKAFPMPF